MAQSFATDTATQDEGVWVEGVTLTIFSSRIGCRDMDALDITRKGNHPQGIIFAPSETILRPALRARDEATKLRRDADDLTIAPTGIERIALLAQAERVERDMWEWYEPAYTEEMRACYRGNRKAWDAVFARRRLVLLCYCATTVLPHCHRIILRGIFVKLGAVDGGEL